MLEAPDEVALGALATRALDAGVEHAVFREPDFAGALTAIALAPSGRRLVSSLPLALRSSKMAAA